VVFDRGTVEGATHCAAVCCGKSRFLACVNGPGGGRVVSGGFEGLPYDLIQEWGFGRSALQELGKVNDEPIVHAVTDASKKVLVGTTSGHLFTVDIEGGSIKVVGEVSGSGRLALGSKGGVFGQDGSAHLWRYDVGSGKIERQAIAFPEGAWGKVPLTWAKDHHSGLLYTADAVGNLFSLEEERGFSGPLARTLLAPVGPMAVTHDGRVFGFCGPEMAKMFCYNPRTREATNLGVAVSVLERRRYGYVFGDAVTGRDGQIIFGEDDDLGHLWLYFPRIQALS
jgi:outer membrane protein assembly factor BamB